MNTTATNTMIADVAQLAEMELNDSPIAAGFSIVVPVLMPEGTRYGTAYELFVRLASEVNTALDRIVSELPAKEDIGVVCDCEFELL